MTLYSLSLWPISQWALLLSLSLFVVLHNFVLVGSCLDVLDPWFGCLNAQFGSLSSTRSAWIQFIFTLCWSVFPRLQFLSIPALWAFGELALAVVTLCSLMRSLGVPLSPLFSDRFVSLSLASGSWLLSSLVSCLSAFLDVPCNFPVCVRWCYFWGGCSLYGQHRTQPLHWDFWLEWHVWA